MSASPDSSQAEEPTYTGLDQRNASNEPDDDWETGDDDDMDFEIAEESTSDDLNESDLEDIEYHDASEDLGSGLEIEFEVTDDDSREGTNELSENDEDEDEGEQTETEPTAASRPAQNTQPVTISQQQILRLLGQAGLRGLFANHGGGRVTIRRAGAADEDEDDEEGTHFGYGAWGRSLRRRRPREDFKFPPVPNPEGEKLMESGTFGLNERRRDTLTRKKKLAHRSMMRELGLGHPGLERSSNKLISHDMIPSTKADTIINYNSRCYSGQFSEDGNFFFSCAQDFRVRMYDTSNPYKWKYYKTAHYHGGAWTITDATLSPDNKYLAYSSIRPEVCLAPTDPDNTADPYTLDFSNLGTGGRRAHHAYGGRWGIWSIRFSGDGREIVAGTSDYSIYAYDLETNQSILRIQGHTDDVNAVCYGDKSSPHILYSGSDDTTLKVWDRRSLGDGREAGVFMGHTEGLTYIDSKGDGRYVISNSKDQTMKLWDLRKMMAPDKAAKIDPQDYSAGFDYRFAPYDEGERRANPHDCSLVTFRGHKVLKTLIRCHFSPQGSTDGRYVYSGSHDGKVYIWNMDATLKGTIDVLEATRNSRPIEDERHVERYDMSGRGQWSTIVRDVAWHPHAPVLAATSWNGWDHGLGTCTVHSWNDGVDDDEAEPKMGARVTAQLEHDPRFYSGSTGRSASQFRRARMRNRRGVLYDDDEEEE